MADRTAVCVGASKSHLHLHGKHDYLVHYLSVNKIQGLRNTSEPAAVHFGPYYAELHTPYRQVYSAPITWLVPSTHVIKHQDLDISCKNATCNSEVLQNIVLRVWFIIDSQTNLVKNFFFFFKRGK